MVHATRAGKHHELILVAIAGLLCVLSEDRAPAAPTSDAKKAKESASQADAPQGAARKPPVHMKKAKGRASQADAPYVLDINVLMSEAQFRGCGLHKLAPEELESLNRWLTRYALTSLTYSASQSPITAAPPASSQGSSLDAYLGCMILAGDGTFLGIISRDRYDSKSLSNRYGEYGSKYSSKSILNRYGVYGSEYSSESPFNRYATDPPVIVRDGQAVAFLTANTLKSPRVDPNALLAWLGIER